MLFNFHENDPEPWFLVDENPQKCENLKEVEEIPPSPPGAIAETARHCTVVFYNNQLLNLNDFSSIWKITSKHDISFTESTVIDARQKSNSFRFSLSFRYIGMFPICRWKGLDRSINLKCVPDSSPFTIFVSKELRISRPSGIPL